MDLQPECFEEGTGQFFGELVYLDPRDGQRVDEVGVGRGLDAYFGGIELGFEVVAAGAELGTAFIDIAQQVGVGIIDEFKVTDRALDPLVGLHDRPFQSGDVLVVVTAGVGIETGCGAVEQGAAVGAEDVVGQEVVEAVDEQVFTDEERPARWVALGGVVLAGSAHVVGVGAAGLAEHAPPAQLAEQVGAQQVGAFRLRVPGVRARRAAGTEAMPADPLDLDERLQADQGLVYRLG